MSFVLEGFDAAAFVDSTLAEDLGGVGDITSAAVIPAAARFAAVMDSRDAIIVCGVALSTGLVRPRLTRRGRSPG